MSIENISKKVSDRYSGIGRYIFPNLHQKALSKETTRHLDDLFFSILTSFEIQSLIECGAREASASKNATKIGLNALAIEANPITFDQITPDADGKFEKLNIGLSDEDGWLDLHIPKDNTTDGSSTFRPNKERDYQTKRVQTKKLDDVLGESIYIQNSFALWIDVEGMQKEVLTGAARVLQHDNCKLIKIEVEDKDFFTGQVWLVRDIYKHLKELGYDAVFRDFEYIGQYNLLFVKGDMLRKVNEGLVRNFKGIRPIPISLILQQSLAWARCVGWAKEVIIRVVGKRLGHKIAAAAGSKSSKKISM
ncbi:FkbM family methyltransferase [Flavimaricola sp.]|nr:FkbM family methyltransferase [Flavimaricola sp.]MDA9020192.1 FkbM family methyltransferase [Flavimaricola sp.]